MKNATSAKSVSKTSRLLIIIGFAFFINPVPLGLDIIPDVFGCALIYFGLTQLAYFDGQIEQARKAALYLFIVEAVKLFMMRSVFLAEISSNRMLAVTVFSVVESILYIMLFKTLFSGINYFAMRNDCNKTLAKCDGTAFLSYLAFFTRIAATLLPELLATVEIHLYSESDTELDLNTLETIEALLSAKPLLVILLSLIALVTGVAWFVSVYKTFTLLHKESGDMIDAKYFAEYSSRPEMVRPKKLNRGIYTLYIALFFALDIAFDSVRIIPAYAMFLLIFTASFMFNGLYDFKETKRFAPFAFIMLLGAEIFQRIFVPYGAIIIYETKLWIICVNAVICLIGVPICLLCIRCFLIETNKLQVSLGGKPLNHNAAWISYCVSIVLWTIGYVVPYFYASVATLRLFASCVFIWQTVKLLNIIKDDEYERFIMYENR